MSTDHYFSEEPGSPSQPREIQAALRGENWRFRTDRGIFSYQRIDPGSRLLIEAMEIAPGDRVLDVGAGYGAIGLVAARLAGPDGHAALLEVNRRAAEVCEHNAQLNGLDNVTVIAAGEIDSEALAPLDVVVSNPPMRAGWKVVDPLLEAAAATLRPGGKMWLVGNKHLGLRSLAKRLEALLGPIETVDRKSGYHVIVATREGGDG